MHYALCMLSFPLSSWCQYILWSSFAFVTFGSSASGPYVYVFFVTSPPAGRGCLVNLVPAEIGIQVTLFHLFQNPTETLNKIKYKMFQFPKIVYLVQTYQHINSEMI